MAKIKNYQRLIVYLLILILVPLLVNYVFFTDKKKGHGFAVAISAYFYNMYTDAKIVTLEKDISYIRSKVTDPELKIFYQNFNSFTKKDKIDYKSKEDATWQLYGIDGQPKANYITYWQTLRPVLNEFYAKNINKLIIDKPVVHFRCSDVPYIKHPVYHLTKKSTVEWMIKKIKERGYDEIIMLTCNKHMSDFFNGCNKFAKFYAHIFEDSGIKVIRQCNSIFHDFTTMVNAPLLIALNTSGYSFMAGIAKDPKDFISCNIGREVNGQYLMQDQADWVQDMQPPLLHNDVKSYNNVAQILYKLSN